MEKMKDRRVQRTRNMIFDALIDLIIKKGYDAITVQDITEYANIGRSTFYFHFTDKEQLLLQNINRMREHLMQHMQPVMAESSRFKFSLAMLLHAKDQKKLYLALVKKNGGATVMHHIQKVLSELVNDEISVLTKSQSSISIPKEIEISFIVSTFTMLLSWWMENDMPISADETDEIFHKLVMSGLSAIYKE